MIKVSLQLLGQSGCRIEYDDTVIFMEPYLSNSVQELDAPDLERCVPVPIKPESVEDADWVLISHDHVDHCDPHTLPQIAAALEGCNFIGPPTVLDKLSEWRVPSGRCHAAEESWTHLNESIAIRSVPATHPIIERNGEGRLICIGFVIEINGNRLYLAGDTSVEDELIDTLLSLKPIAAALMPVNEHNFYRGRRGIIGNMSVRGAFHLADEIGMEVLIPVHWDMFEVNSVELEEIRDVYRRMIPAFDLQTQPTSIEF